MVDLDLDLFAPEAKNIKIGGKIIPVEQPSTQQLFKLMAVGKMMSELDPNDSEQVTATIGKAAELVCEIIPDLTGQNLNFAQVMAVIELVSEMALPKQLKELEKQGVTPAEIPKDRATS